MKKIHGNLIDLAEQGKFDVIIQGCNCWNVQSAGLAKEIKKRYPQAYEADLQTRKGDVSKLGTYSHSLVISNVNSDIEFTIINAYTQYKYWGSSPNINYKAVQSVMKLIKKDFSGKKIGYPLIGAGLAGGNWTILENIINSELQGENHTLVVFKKE
jgi:O-acetyl-ADP-ribose deacetylase (regulator of RNase III)